MTASAKMSEEQRQAIKQVIAASLGVYQQSHATESSHQPFPQMSLNTALGMLMTIGTLFGPEEALAIRSEVEAERGIKVPTPTAIDDLIHGRVDVGAILGVTPGPARRGTVKYKSAGEEHSVMGLIGKTEDEGRTKLVVHTDDDKYVIIEFSQIVTIEW